MQTMPTEIREAYPHFLESKIAITKQAGVDVMYSDLHPGLYQHQCDTVIWALRLGRALIAKSFGLGKTRDQIEIARQLVKRSGQPFLVVCPLGVKHQFSEEDGPAMATDWLYVKTDEDIRQAVSEGKRYFITNYERVREGGINPPMHQFCGVSLDEGSVMARLGNKTSDVFLKAFKDVPFRFVATATPAPNSFRELIYYARYLGIMDHGQALTRWFKRNSTKAGDLQLMPHKEEEFWLWVASWALFLYRPSDLGYDDSGYDLPELHVHWHEIKVDHTRAFGQTDNYGQHRLLLDAASGVKEASAEKRATMEARLMKMLEILQEYPLDENGLPRHWLLWHDLEDERRAIEKAVKGSVSVYGSQKLELRESRILGFVHGKIPILATKPEIAGSGCNFQRHCWSNVFLGVGYKFEDFIQAVHRTYRFQQRHDVDIHIIYAESERRVVDVLRAKWQQHNELTEKMRDIIKRYGLVHEAIKRDLTRTIGVAREMHIGKRFTAVNNDCVLEMPGIPANSIDMILSSIPFSTHYEYVASYNDFGHNDGDDGFFRQMDFLIPELLRALIPGRVAAIHVKDLIRYGHQTPSGFMEVNPFAAKTIFAFMKHGFLFEGEIVITTDVVRENNSTYRLGWSEMCKDGSKMGVGLPEKVLIFRKPPSQSDTAYADKPVVHTKDRYTRARWQIDAHSHWRTNGNALVAPYDYHAHVARLQQLEDRRNLPSTFFYEPPVSNNPLVWDDINPMRCLNAELSRRNLALHVCPLPLDITERLVERFTSDPEATGERETVLDPFAGLGTSGYTAIQLGRKAYLVELGEEFYSYLVRFCSDIEQTVTAPTLFDYLDKLKNGGEE